jgi:RNA polymerase sigma-70 factor, ECF subfamily
LASEAARFSAMNPDSSAGRLSMTSSDEETPEDLGIDPDSMDEMARGEGESRYSETDRFISQFAENQHAIYAYTRTLVQNRSDAEDIMQNVSIALWKKWHTFDPATSFLRWAFAVAFIEILRYRRKSAKDRLWFSESLMELLSADVQQNAEVHSSRLDALSNCLEKLDLDDRRLIEIRYRQGASAQSVADEFNKPLSTIYKMLLRVRQSLRNCINRSVAAQSHPSNS